MLFNLFLCICYSRDGSQDSQSRRAFDDGKSSTSANDVIKTSEKNKNFRSAKKDNKISLFQRLKRVPTIKDAKKTFFSEGKLLKSKSSHNLNSIESQGVVFVEPNYKPNGGSAEENNSKFRFDYSNSWQHLGRFSQL